MNVIFLFIITLIIILMFGDNFKKSNQIYIGEYKTINFQKDSIEFYRKLEKESGYSVETLQEFAMLEDQFLSYEKETVCHQISRLREAMVLDQQMKDRFQGWDFMYHQIHIKQMAEPSKVINKNLNCS
jgi:hypothetical protein